jgi:hypothetical protein
MFGAPHSAGGCELDQLPFGNEPPVPYSNAFSSGRLSPNLDGRGVRAWLVDEMAYMSLNPKGL